MKKLIILGLILIATNVDASVADFQGRMGQITGTIPAEAGIMVVSLDKKDILFSKNANVPLNPASTTKLITAAAALKLLGPDFRFHTKFFMSPENDLFIYGYGDPSMVIENLQMIAKELVKKGVKNIRNIVVNDTYFDNYKMPGIEGKERYDFYTGALSLNFNRIVLQATPTRVGEYAKVLALAGNVPIDIKSEVKTVGKGRGPSLQFKPPLKDNEYTFVVTGTVPVRSKARSLESHVPLPPLYFTYTLKALLEQNGTKVVGGIYRGEKPSNADLKLDYASKALSEILKDMNKFSNNFIAEQLLKTLGAEKMGSPGSTAKGVEVLKQYLKDIGIQEKSVALVNGSGLTYENRMTSEQMIRVIADMFSSPKLWPAYEDSFAIAGLDGTLRRRHKRDTLFARMKAKTGTLNSVSTIAGTIKSNNNETIAFSILMNGDPNISRCHQVQDQIAMAIAEFSRQ